MVNKNQMIHTLKEYVKKLPNRIFDFAPNTRMMLDYYEEYVDTELLSLYLKNGVLYLTTKTEEYGNDVDRLSDFHQTIVADIYYEVQKIAPLGV